jgi:hypothetical protein
MKSKACIKSYSHAGSFLPIGFPVGISVGLKVVVGAYVGVGLPVYTKNTSSH